MDKERLESLLIDFIDERLAVNEKLEVEQLLHSNEEARTLYAQLRKVTRAMDQSVEFEPGARLRKRFQQDLIQEQRIGGKQVFFRPVVWRAAAAVALVMVGVAIGFLVNQKLNREEELATLRKEMEATKAMMMTLMENQLSASQRMKGVNVAMTIRTADDEVVGALVRAMNEDLNSNVRLAALEALSKFHEEPAVRMALIQSLSTQKDPVVQIALIQLMVRMKEKSAVKDLNRIIEDIHTIKAVKDEAYTGLLKLS